MNRDNRPLLPKIMDLLLDTVCVVDPEGKFVFVSASCEALLGYTPDELIGRQMIDLVHPADRERTQAAAAAVMEGRSHIHFENRYLRKDGSVVDIMWSARWSEEDQLRLAVARDVTPLRAATRKQNALYEISEAAFVAEDLPALYQHVHRIVNQLIPSDLFLVATCDRATDSLDFPYCSERRIQGARQPMGKESPLAAVVGTGRGLLLSSRNSIEGEAIVLPGIGEYSECLLAPLAGAQSVTGVLVMARTGGDTRYGEEDRDLLMFVCTQVATAIERKRDEARLQYLATHDPLTDLPNRALFNDRFQMARHRAARRGERLALFYVDLDNFKEINDNFGHDAGDEILREVAVRLSRCVRQSDTVARIGGDEFAILADNIDGPSAVDRLGEKIRATVATPFAVNGASLNISASTGAAVYPDHGSDRKRLLRYADSHMYRAKHGNRR